MSKTLLSGPKFNSAHSTYVEGAVTLLTFLKSQYWVKKIFLGEISRCSPGTPTCKIRHIEGRLITLLFRDTVSIQVFRIVISEDDRVKNLESFLNETINVGATRPKNNNETTPKPLMNKASKKNVAKKQKPKEARLVFKNVQASPKLGDLFPLTLTKSDVATCSDKVVGVLSRQRAPFDSFLELGRKFATPDKLAPGDTVMWASRYSKTTEPLKLDKATLVKWLDNGDALLALGTHSNTREVRANSVTLYQFDPMLGDV